MYNFFYNIYSISIELYIVISIIILLIYGVFFSTFIKYGYPLVSSNMGWLVLQVFCFCLLLAYSQIYIYLFSWNKLLIFDFFVWGIQLVIFLVLILWWAITFIYIRNQKILFFEYWVLILFSVIGILFVIKSYDFLSIYLSIEFQSLIFYILASINRSSEFSTEAGLKYFILGAFSSAFLLLGFSIIYGLTGITNLGDFSKLFSGTYLFDCNFSIIIGLIFVLVSLMFKLSAAPFHMWVPDVYEGSPSSITVFFSIFPKYAIICLCLRLLVYSFHDYIIYWREFILLCTILCTIVGTLGAFYQYKWKRFLAYSSINHISFLLLALMIGDLQSIYCIIFYIVIYSVIMIGIFSIVLSLYYYDYPNYYQLRYIKNIISLNITNPILTFSLSLLLFSVSGIPPFAGFFSKLFILLSSLQVNSFGICLFLILFSCVSCFYYIRLIKIMYFEINQNLLIIYPLPKSISIALGISLIINIFLIFDLDLIYKLSIFLSLSFL
uniref:NADH dehydrogenase subunit 2 n=1 Tax=Plocamiocolax pulvinatus TaxID=35206 RepID=E5Q3G3_9FLOR|nr:NADH dehydrogenase subunit 2 [Plocamiocolax pulvinata]ADR03246.1 NADH dehydrogenase subunit 2 [Plocamiocolax pulvinata]